MGPAPTLEIRFLCRDCGYDLRSRRDHRCPECGERYDPADPDSYVVVHGHREERLARRRLRWLAGMAIVCLTGWLTAPLLPAPIAVLFLGTLPLVAVILSIVVGPTAFGASMEVRRRFTWTTAALVACFVPWAIVFGGWLLER